MYILPELMEEVKKPIENYALTDENLMSEAFDHFEEASAALMTNCHNVLKVKIKTLQDAAEFASKYASTEFAVSAFKLLATLKIQSCSNCRSNPCKDGEWVVDINTLTVGCVLQSAGFRSYQQGRFGGLGSFNYYKVVDVDVESEEFTVGRVDPGYTYASAKIG